MREHVTCEQVRVAEVNLRFTLVRVAAFKGRRRYCTVRPITHVMFMEHEANLTRRA